MSFGGSRRAALAALCVTEVVSYGVLFYAFALLAGDIVADTGWSRTAVTAAFSAGLLMGALAGAPVGRLIDRRGPRPVMTAGSTLAVTALFGVAAAPTFAWFVAAWLVAGVAMAGVFYPPAFAALTGWYGPDRVRALTTLTLVAGFASTIFAPLTAQLGGHLSWRGVYVVLAIVLAAITIPAHALALRLPWVSRRPGPTATVDTSDRRVLISRTFLVLVAAMTLNAFALYAVVINLVPLLTGRGLSSSAAAWALGLGGIGQVIGRLGYRSLAAHTGVRARSLVVISTGAVTTLLLALLPAHTAPLLAAAVAAGAARGLFTLLTATIVADHWGSERYATLNGMFTTPLTAATAIAPTVGAALATGLGSYHAMFVVLAAVSAVSAGLAATTTTPTPSTPTADVQGRG